MKLPSILGLGVVVAIYLALCTLYAVSIPAWNAPDEPAHFNYIRQLAESREFPVLSPGDYDAARLEKLKADRFPPSESIASIRYEGHQPPLFYLLDAPVYLATARLPLAQQVIALRMVSSLWGALALVAAYGAARQFLSPWLSVAAAGVMSTIPMYVFITASINNDSLSVLVVSAVLWLGAWLLKVGETSGRAPEQAALASAFPLLQRPYLVLGVLMGMALLTKTTAYIVLGLVAALALAPRAGQVWLQSTLPAGARRMASAFSIAALIAGWWFVRNAMVYGWPDIFGLRRHDLVVVGQPLTGALTWGQARSMLETAFRSFWAQFGWMGVLVDDRIYQALGMLCLLAGAGLAWWLVHVMTRRERLAPSQGRVLLLFLLSFGLTAAAMVQYNLAYLQPQGRYLFAALAPLSVLFVLGLNTLAPRLARPVIFTGIYAGLVLLDVLCLFRFILPDLQA